MPVTPLEQQVCDSIAADADESYALLERHVAIPTGKDHVPGLDAYRSDLRARLESLDAATELRDGVPRPAWMAQGRSESDELPAPSPTLVARRKGDTDRPRILIAGHIDTVHEPSGPFQHLVRQPDGIHATGPGAVDMKGGIVVALAALQALHTHVPGLPWTVVLNSDEETGSFQSDHVLRELAAQHDFGIALEPALADGSLAIERMGSGQFMIEVHGVAAHVGREFEKGRSSVTRLGEILLTLAEMARPDEGMIVNVGPIVGGAAANVVPDHAACWGNVRFKNEEIADRLGAMIDALGTLEPSTPGRGQGEGLHVTVHRNWNRPAKPLTPEVHQFANLARTAAEDLGQKLPFASTGGVCDGNILQAVGLPTIDTLGIRGGNLHRTDEFIEITALVERAQLLAVVLMRLAR